MSQKTVRMSLIALFRFRLISEVETRVLGGASKSAVIEELAARRHPGSDGQLVSVSSRTLYRWCSAYEKRGYEGLEPTSRPQIQDSRALSRKLVDFLSSEKQDDPAASVPELIRRARLRGIVAEDAPICRTSVWRACRRLSLPTRRMRLADRDRRRFAYPHRMMMILSDGKHFRAGTTRAKRVVLTFLDDATRFGLGLLVAPSESTEAFLRGLYDVVRQHGLMRAIYLDNGPGFASGDTADVIAGLDRHLILGTKGYAEGHGKIERYHRTLTGQVLRSFDGNPEIDPDLGALTLRLRHWLTSLYNHTPHEGLGGLSPAERWERDTRQLDHPERVWLDDRFLLPLVRRVTKANTVSYESVHYEVPIGHAGERITLHRHLLDGDRLSMIHRGHRVFLQGVDLTRNAFDRRASGSTPPSAPAPTDPPKTAADLAFSQDFESLVGPDGGFPEGDPDDD